MHILLEDKKITINNTIYFNFIKQAWSEPYNPILHLMESRDKDITAQWLIYSSSIGEAAIHNEVPVAMRGVFSSYNNLSWHY